jgi:hypothetical protein
MGPLDIAFKALIGIPYPIKGVMYCTVDRVEPGGLYDQKLIGNPEGFVFQDAIGDYYYFYEFSQGGDEYLAKFRALCEALFSGCSEICGYGPGMARV